MIRKKGPSGSEPDDNLDADAQAAGLEHWSAPPGEVPSAFDTEDDGLGPSWQTDEDDDKWGTELGSVFADDDVDTGQFPDVKPSPNYIGESQLPTDDLEALTKKQRPEREGRRGENDPRVARARRIAAERAAAQRIAAQTPELDEVEDLDLEPDVDRGAPAVAVENLDPSMQMPVAEETIVEDVDGFEEAAALRPKLDRNLGQATAVGLILFAAAAAMLLVNEFTAIALVGIVALLAVAELYQAMKSEVLSPAKLLGYVSVLAIPTAAFFRGTEAFPLVIALIVVFGALWFLTGADSERPVLNLSLTLLGVVWIGGLAGFAGLLLGSDYEVGRQLLLVAIVVTVVSDTFAYFGGKAYGKTPFHQASPNKTWEGALTGFLGALATGLLIGIIADIVTNDNIVFKNEFTAAIAFAATIGVLSPVGDLAQSMLKRDLGVKDMGSILPGHGGVFDRIDGLLFALPGAYYIATFFDLIAPFN